ncbi:MAG: bifunctional rhamnulose-1-phosphate aldolase/short-chain dehydrogenase [Candidatus Omnitrophica bacterium]|nr:bifunctional rhamnulose-1-phosphate aldolase/short-chain dehydrogenase [Candidatus Omnitrophota bacterium]
MTPLEALVARSRRIGAQERLGLFGGGNTSIKCAQPDLFGRPQEVLWVKGSGADLNNCSARHFAPLALAPLQRMAARADMSDEEMVRFLERCLLDPKAPRPSVETLLHAFIPQASVDHTHADAILALANTRRGRHLTRRILGPELLWIPYIQPGFRLSRYVWEAYRDQPQAHGAVLEKHGLITWGPDGRTSLKRTIDAVSRAERFIHARRRKRSWSSVGCAALSPNERSAWLRRRLPVLRRVISQHRRMSLTVWDSPDILEFVNARRMPRVARIGPATPDHMLRTKRLPLIARASDDMARRLHQYADAHRRYFLTYRRTGQAMQDPFPRVMLIPGVGMITTGKDAAETARVAMIYRHAMAIMRDASTVGAYTSVSAREAFGVEYWPLELYKLTLAPPEPEFARQIGLITGAAGGIGRAIAHCLASRGASVIVTDLHAAAVEQLAEAINRRVGRRCALGLGMDVTSERSVDAALDRVLRQFGGLDFLVSNAGIAHVAAVDRLELSQWERSLAVNATGHFLVSRAVVRLLKAQGLGGALVFIASKNVLAPGKDFGAYSAAKAAQTQLARILAIENGEHQIRVNLVNPDGVFEGSGLWNTIKASRAKSYGITPKALESYYQGRNLLQARVLPEDVAEAVAFFISAKSAKTTGCILTVDGGVREAFPR